MEKPAPNSNSNSHSGHHYYQKNHRKQSSHVSMSDNDSTASPIDSFHSPLRYEEQLQESNSKSPASKAIIAVDKYCLALNVIGFVYSGFQGFNLSYLLATNSSSSGLRHQFNFVMDQASLLYFYSRKKEENKKHYHGHFARTKE
nr:CASP-like protein 4A3 [Ipomoea batatas]